MTNPTEPHEDRRLRRKTAAFRLKHDIGKALRWSAPEGERERDPEELKGRLRRDLLSRANGGAAGRNVLESFLEWKREEGPLFAGGDADLEALERAMAKVAGLANISALSESDLHALDDACLEASRGCTAFYRRIAVEDGPETIRPLGARR